MTSATCNTFGSPLLLLTNFRYTISSCTSNASQLLQSFFLSSDFPSISSFVGLSVNVMRNWTIRLNSVADRCCSMRFSLTEEVFTLFDEQSSLIRSIAFTFGRLPMSGLVASGLRLKPSALPCRFPLQRFLYRLLVQFRVLFSPTCRTCHESSLFWRLIRTQPNRVIWSATTLTYKILRSRYHVRSTPFGNVTFSSRSSDRIIGVQSQCYS